MSLIIIFAYRLRSVSRLIFCNTPISYLHNFIRSLTIVHNLKFDPMHVHVLQWGYLKHPEISSLLPTGPSYRCVYLPPMSCLLHWIFKVTVAFKQWTCDLLWRKQESLFKHLPKTWLEIEAFCLLFDTLKSFNKENIEDSPSHCRGMILYSSSLSPSFPQSPLLDICMALLHFHCPRVFEGTQWLTSSLCWLHSTELHYGENQLLNTFTKF